MKLSLGIMIIAFAVCDASFVIININEGKMVKKIEIKNDTGEYRGIKKIKLAQIGECLIYSHSSNNSIKLLSI